MAGRGTVIYLDYNATTPLRPDALEAMRPYHEVFHGNPSSMHGPGREARAALDSARDALADILGARPHELIFTSGGTESNNLAILGAARSRASRGRHLVSCATEHHAVLHPLEYLRDHEGFELTLLGVDREGRVDPEQVAAALRPETTLVSIMSANNETGTRHPVAEIGAALDGRDVLFHVDAVQSFGKHPVRPVDWKADLVSISAHKFYGPKGAGLLFAGSGVSLAPTMLGGFHENQRRAGTENVAGIVGMARAAQLVAGSEQDRRLFEMTERLWDGLKRFISGIHRNGHRIERIGNTLNVSFEQCDGEALLINFDLEGIAVSSGSACMVGSIQPSHVLLAMGVAPELAQATVRFSLGTSTTDHEITEVIDKAPAIVKRTYRKT